MNDIVSTPVNSMQGAPVNVANPDTLTDPEPKGKFDGKHVAFAQNTYAKMAFSEKKYSNLSPVDQKFIDNIIEQNKKIEHLLDEKPLENLPQHENLIRVRCVMVSQENRIALQTKTGAVRDECQSLSDDAQLVEVFAPVTVGSLTPVYAEAVKSHAEVVERELRPSSSD